MEKKILIVVDMQNDFIDGALGTAEAQAIVPAVIDRINECRKAGWTLIATPLPHCPKRQGTFWPC